MPRLSQLAFRSFTGHDSTACKSSNIHTLSVALAIPAAIFYDFRHS
jgi:hypothetical protein